MPEHEVHTGRRQFIQGIAVAVGALAAGRSVAEDRKIDPRAAVKGPGMKLDRAKLSTLSNQLYASPAERQKFIADPQGYAAKALGGPVGDADKLKQMADQFADGVCCGGCGC